MIAVFSRFYKQRSMVKTAVIAVWVLTLLQVSSLASHYFI